MRKKPVRASNMMTGEILEFDSQYALSLYFLDLYGTDICSGNIKRIIKQRRPYKGIWIIEYI